MKKSTFGLIATAAMILSPVSAMAQSVQNNAQFSDSSAAAVGVGNFVNQNTTQTSFQDQFDLNDYYNDGSIQNNIQGSSSAASAVGEHNFVNQVTDQYSGQTNTDIESYGGYYGY